VASATVTVYVSVAAILVPLIVKYFNDLHMAWRNARLIRVTEQLNGFYGPLLALTSASNKNWDYFRSRYRADGGAYWSQNPPPTGAEAEAWRR
jgi:hypothetical protein